MAKKSLFAIDLEEDVFEEKKESPVVQTKQAQQSVKYCVKCKAQVISGAKFCGECGGKEFVEDLEVLNHKYCIHCGTELDTNIKYCYNCGKNEFVRTKEEYDQLQKEKEFAPYKEEIKLLDEQTLKVKEESNKLKQEIADLKNKLNGIKIPTLNPNDLPKEYVGNVVLKQKFEQEIKDLENQIKNSNKKLQQIEKEKYEVDEAHENRINYLTRLYNQAKKALEEIERSIKSYEGGI